MPDPHFLPATAVPATSSDVFGPLQGGERSLWQGRCAVAEYAFDQAASLPRWALPEATEVLITDRRIVYAYTRAESADGFEVTSGELRWLWPTHLRVQPGALTAGHSSTAAQIQLVCTASDGTFPALVFAGGELATVASVDKLANVIRLAIARFRVDNATRLGLSTQQARMLSRLLIGPEFSNYQGGEGQTVNLLGALAVHRPADTEPPADPDHASYAEPQADYAAYAEPQADYPQYTESDADYATYPEPESDHAPYAEPEPSYAPYTQAEPDHAAYGEPQAGYAPYTEPQADYTAYTEPHADYAAYAEPQADYAQYTAPDADYDQYAAPQADYAGYAEPQADYAQYTPPDADYNQYTESEAGYAPYAVEPESESLLLASLRADLPQPPSMHLAEAPPYRPDDAAADGPYPAPVSGPTVRLPGFRPGLAADEARALQAAAAEQNTHRTQPDLASRAASLAARVANLVAEAEEAAAAQAAAEWAAEQARAVPEPAAEEQSEAEEQAADSSEAPTTDLTARAERVRRSAARFAANSARGKAGTRRPEPDLGSPSRGNRTY